MVQYYIDIQHKRRPVLAPLTDLVDEIGHTNVTKANKTKKRAYYWTDMHQEAFDTITHTLSCKVILAYPQQEELFEIYIDASTYQLVAVTTYG